MDERDLLHAMQEIDGDWILEADRRRKHAYQKADGSGGSGVAEETAETKETQGSLKAAESTEIHEAVKENEISEISETGKPRENCEVVKNGESKGIQEPRELPKSGEGSKKRFFRPSRIIAVIAACLILFFSVRLITGLKTGSQAASEENAAVMEEAAKDAADTGAAEETDMEAAEETADMAAEEEAEAAMTDEAEAADGGYYAEDAEPVEDAGEYSAENGEAAEEEETEAAAEEQAETADAELYPDIPERIDSWHLIEAGETAQGNLVYASYGTDGQSEEFRVLKYLTADGFDTSFSEGYEQMYTWSSGDYTFCLEIPAGYDGGLPDAGVLEEAFSKQ